MRPTPLAIVFATLLVGCAPTNPIDRLVTRLSTDTSFGSEAYTPIALAATVRHEVVVERAIEQHYKHKEVLHKVLEVREDLHIKGRVYTAVLISTNTGREIVLVGYDERAEGWWSHVYDR
jgi:hypothetical protein